VCMRSPWSRRRMSSKKKDKQQISKPNASHNTSAGGGNSDCSRCRRRCLLVLAIVPVVCVALFAVLDTQISRGFIFEPNTLHQISLNALKEHQNTSFQAVIASIVRQLEAAYPGHINLEQQWIFNNAGGAMGQMYLIHCSISEYVIIFGTPIGTEGHTGRFFADDYFIILKGEQQAYYVGSFERESYTPGKMHHLPRGWAQGYRCPDHCFALEYARGWVPLMLPFGVADTLTSTLDIPTLSSTFYLYAKLVIKELLQGKV